MLRPVYDFSFIKQQPIPKRPTLLFSFLLFCYLILALTLLPANLLAADSLTEADFSPSLLSALNNVLSQPLTLPMAADDPALAVTDLDLSGKSISGLKGIEYFSSLTSLKLDYNKLTNTNGVMFPDKIKILSLAHNSLKEVSATHWPAVLENLDLRNNALTSPLGLALPPTVARVQLDNNFLKGKISSPAGRVVTYNGNFIYEAGSIRPASLVVKDITSLSLYFGGQAVVPFVGIYSSTNPNNPVPSSMLNATLDKNNNILKLDRQEYRFLLQANATGKDVLTIQLFLTDYMQTQYEEMNQTFFKVRIPVTVWQSAAERMETHSSNNGDTALESALAGRSLNAIVDMTRFTKGEASFSPGLMAQLAGAGKKLILTHDFGNLVIDSNCLKALTNQASAYPTASVVLMLDACELHPAGYGPSRFSAKEIYALAYPDFNFNARLQIPGASMKQLEINAPITATLYLKNQNFNTWDLSHLTAFKDNNVQLQLLGGTYNDINGSFVYRLDGTGHYGLGTRGKVVRWMDLAINSTALTFSQGNTETLSPAPLLIQGTTMVPARTIFEAMGATVRWNSFTNTTTIAYGDKTFYLQDGAVISGTNQKVYVVSGRMLVPLRFISNEIGASVLWWSYGGNIRIVY